jgi:hypothetical protein
MHKIWAYSAPFHPQGLPFLPPIHCLLPAEMIPDGKWWVGSNWKGRHLRSCWRLSFIALGLDSLEELPRITTSVHRSDTSTSHECGAASTVCLSPDPSVDPSTHRNSWRGPTWVRPRHTDQVLSHDRAFIWELIEQSNKESQSGKFSFMFLKLKIQLSCLPKMSGKSFDPVTVRAPLLPGWARIWGNLAYSEDHSEGGMGYSLTLPGHQDCLSPL